MVRHAEPASGELALVNEAHAGYEEGDRRGGPVHFGRERRGGPRLVVVLEKAHRPPLVLGIRAEVIDDRSGVRLPQTIVEALVVRVVEALLLQGCLEIPVRLGHEQEVRVLIAYLLDGARPERRVDRGATV